VVVLLGRYDRRGCRLGGGAFAENPSCALRLPKTSSALVGADLRGFAVSSSGVRRSTLTRLVIAPGIMAIVLLRLAYLTVTNAFAMLRLMPMSVFSVASPG
jgi:hypothetical protein